MSVGTLPPIVRKHQRASEPVITKRFRTTGRPAAAVPVPDTAASRDLGRPARACGEEVEARHPAWRRLPALSFVTHHGTAAVIDHIGPGEHRQAVGTGTPSLSPRTQSQRTAYP